MICGRCGYNSKDDKPGLWTHWSLCSEDDRWYCCMHKHHGRCKAPVSDSEGERDRAD